MGLLVGWLVRLRSGSGGSVADRCLRLQTCRSNKCDLSPCWATIYREEGAASTPYRRKPSTVHQELLSLGFDVDHHHHACFRVLEDVAVHHPAASIDRDQTNIQSFLGVNHYGISEEGLVDGLPIACQ